VAERPRERWRPIPAWEGLYEVSDQGRVRSVRRQVAGRGGSIRTLQGKILSPRIRPDGTRAVNLWRGNVYEQKPVRRLVLEAFTGKPQPRGYEAKNINEDPADNRFKNLKWEPVGGLAVLLGARR
jgi:NUMOD4 motif